MDFSSFSTLTTPATRLVPTASTAALLTTNAPAAVALAMAAPFRPPTASTALPAAIAKSAPMPAAVAQRDTTAILLLSSAQSARLAALNALQGLLARCVRQWRE